MVEVDISFPTEIHELVNQCVPCPETIIPKAERFSEYQQALQVLPHANTNTGNLVAQCFTTVKHTVYIIQLKTFHSS